MHWAPSQLAASGTGKIRIGCGPGTSLLAMSYTLHVAPVYCAWAVEASATTAATHRIVRITEASFRLPRRREMGCFGPVGQPPKQPPIIPSPKSFPAIGPPFGSPLSGLDVPALILAIPHSASVHHAAARTPSLSVHPGLLSRVFSALRAAGSVGRLWRETSQISAPGPPPAQWRGLRTHARPVRRPGSALFPGSATDIRCTPRRPVLRRCLWAPLPACRDGLLAMP